MIRIEDLTIDEDFDEVFYEKQIPAVIGYYENSNHSKRLRYYHHYLNYGHSLFRNVGELEKKIIGNVEINDLNFDESLHEKRYPDAKHYLKDFVELIPKRKRYYHHYINYCIPGSDTSQLKDTKTYIKNIKEEFLRSNKLYEKHKGSIVLVNHFSNPYGATHYIFSLFSLLKKNNLKVCILDEKINRDLYDKYGVSPDEVFSYEQDFLFLCYLYERLDPKLFYVNSVRGIFVEFLNSHKNERIITHSHEVADVFGRYNLMPTYVVSKRIQEDFEKTYNYRPLIQPPIFLQETFDLINTETAKEIPVVENSTGKIDSSKITIGMCGQTEQRKNPDLFFEVSKKYPEFNFLWIGGKGNHFSCSDNFYHVPETRLPFVYYKLIDYFILSSEEDPCPYVVLENLYVNNRVIAFKDNIFTDHKCDQLKHLYFEFDGGVSLDSVSYMINNYVKSKNDRSDGNGRSYILHNFTKINEDLLKILSNSSFLR